MGWGRGGVAGVVGVCAALAQGSMLTFPLDGDLTNQNYYYLDLSFGLNPATSTRWNNPAANNYSKCLVDTGSSNLAVASPDCCTLANVNGVTQREQCGTHYFEPELCFDMENPYCTLTGGVSMEYVEGNWHGQVYRGDVGFCPPEASSTCQLSSTTEFAVITEQADFFSGSFTCIVGLAYPSIARGGITPYFTQLVDNRKTQDLFSLQFCFTPTAFTWSWASDGYVVNSHGQRVSVDTSGDGYAGAAFMMWEDCPTCPVAAASDGTLNNTAVMWTPIPVESYYTVTVTSMMVGGSRLDLDCGAYNAPAKSIVDSGTTVLNLPGPVFDATVAKLAPALSNVLGIPESDATAFLNGDATLPLNTWRFIWDCPSCPSPAHPIACDLADCGLCINLELYNQTLHQIAQLPDISIGLMSENSPDDEFFLHVPPMQYLNQDDSINWVSCMTSASDSCLRELQSSNWQFMVQPHRSNADSALTIGQTALHNTHVTFDVGNGRVGFAAATCPYTGLVPLKLDVAEDSIVLGDLLAQHRTATKVSGIQRRAELSSCASPTHKRELSTLAKAMIGVCSVLAFAILALLIEWWWRARKERKYKSYGGIRAASDEERAMFETETWGRTTTNPVVTRAGASHYEMDTLEPEAVATSEGPSGENRPPRFGANARREYEMYDSD